VAGGRAGLISTGAGAHQDRQIEQRGTAFIAAVPPRIDPVAVRPDRAELLQSKNVQTVRFPAVDKDVRVAAGRVARNGPPTLNGAARLVVHYGLGMLHRISMSIK